MWGLLDRNELVQGGFKVVTWHCSARCFQFSGCISNPRNSGRPLSSLSHPRRCYSLSLQVEGDVHTASVVWHHPVP